MTDDVWRSKGKDDDDFGPPLFGDEEVTDPNARAESAATLSFDDTGSLPHWTEPATGEIPRVFESVPEGASDVARDPTDDLDVWSSFSAQAPVWSDDAPTNSDIDFDLSGEISRPDSSQSAVIPVGTGFETATIGDPDVSGATVRPRREPGRITIGTDPTDEGMGRPSGQKGSRASREEAAARAARTGRPVAKPGAKPGSKSAAGIGGRDMPTAVAVGAIMAAAFVGAIISKPLFVLAIVVLVLGLASVEFFEKVREKGYQPASVVGIVACVAAPVAAYWIGVDALPLVLVLAFIAGCVSFIGAPSLASNPMPNMSITTLGFTWIGLFGAYGALFLHAQNNLLGGHTHIGTDTLMLLAIGVVANDVGALLVGSAAGRTPLRGWISPNKSVEGFIGGAVLTIIAMVLVGFTEKSHTWSSTPHLILLGIVITILAPVGDLAESMFKRNLDVKDFGTMVKGHGGVLDRFDGFLFVLPGVYYLMLVLEPWTKYVAK